MKRFSFAVLLAACSGPSPHDDGGVDRCVVDIDCSDDLFCNGEEQCAPNNDAADGRGCVEADAPACDEMCDEANDTCGACEGMADVDGDGDRAVACGGGDCDDNDPNRASTAIEVCDEANIDEDCTDTTFGGRDADDDGFIDDECCNGTHCGDDCDDSRTNVSVLAPEVCDGIDNDCDELIDDGVLVASWPDEDDDEYGDMAATPMMTCTLPTGRVDNGGDCDDDDATINPEQAERCGGTDEDCDGETDEPAGADAWCASTRAGAEVSCMSGACVVTGCTGSRFDCDGDNDDCEVDLCSDPLSCDGCGWRCYGTTPFCGSGECTVRATAVTMTTLHDADTGLPIAGATVTFAGTCGTHSVVTGADGTFEVYLGATWARIEAPGYPAHLQPPNPSGSADIYGPIVSQAHFDAWLADPDLGLTPSPDRAILIADMEPDSFADLLTTARGFVVRGADGNDLLPTGALRQIWFDVLPGRATIGGSVSISGCSTNCGPLYDLFLQAGLVSYTRGFSCSAVCS